MSIELERVPVTDEDDSRRAFPANEAPSGLHLRNRGILRGRFFLGAALFLAALITWGIGFTMDPHGDTVAKGTDYLRTSIITFKRNGAIGTILLSAVAAWLLFPVRRPKWPLRDWTLAVLLAFLGASSIYTLVWATIAVAHAQNAAGDGDGASITAKSNASAGIGSAQPLNADVSAPPEFSRPAEHTPVSSAHVADRSPRGNSAQSASADAAAEPPADSDESTGPNANAPANGESDQNER